LEAIQKAKYEEKHESITSEGIPDDEIIEEKTKEKTDL